MSRDKESAWIDSAKNGKTFIKKSLFFIAFCHFYDYIGPISGFTLPIFVFRDFLEIEEFFGFCFSHNAFFHHKG